MKRIEKILTKNIKGKRVLILFLITNLIYAFMLIITIPKVMIFSNGIKLLDMMPTGYDSAYVENLFNLLGEKGRNTYLYRQIPIDMIYPLFFGISYCLLLAYFLDKLKKLNSFYIYLCLLPIIAGIFDYLENLGIITMLINYPVYSQKLIVSTNIFTIIKSMTTTIYFVTLIIILIILGIKTINRKKQVSTMYK